MSGSSNQPKYMFRKAFMLLAELSKTGGPGQTAWKIFLQHFGQNPFSIPLNLSYGEIESKLWKNMWA